jgi:hypothetical protein
MRLGEAFTALLSTAEKRRNRFVSADERELIDACEARRAHREAERGIKCKSSRAVLSLPILQTRPRP